MCFSVAKLQWNLVSYNNFQQIYHCNMWHIILACLVATSSSVAHSFLVLYNPVFWMFVHWLNLAGSNGFTGYHFGFYNVDLTYQWIFCVYFIDNKYVTTSHMQWTFLDQWNLVSSRKTTIELGMYRTICRLMATYIFETSHTWLVFHKSSIFHKNWFYIESTTNVPTLFEVSQIHFIKIIAEILIVIKFCWFQNWI